VLAPDPTQGCAWTDNVLQYAQANQLGMFGLSHNEQTWLFAAQLVVDE
jgi:hypothetical protein